MHFTNISLCHTQVILVIMSMVMVNGSTCSHNITVSSTGTLNTSDCWYNQHDPCSRLSDALNATNYLKNVCIYVLSDVVLLKSVTIENVANIVLSGIDQQVKVCCVDLAGLSFLNSSNIVISNLIFENCSTNHTSTSYNSTNPLPLPIYSALYFSGCNDTTFNRVYVSHSNGTGVTMYDVNGLVNISYSVFTNNVPYHGNGGGGLYIEFTYENPEYGNISQSSPANYIIYECHFTNNVADVNGENVTLFIRPSGNEHLSFSRGGGISVYFKGTAQNKNISISNCLVDNNSAYWGAGIFAEFQDRSNNNNFIVNSTSITNNKCPRLNKNSGTGGGGVRTGFIFYDPTTIHDNSISFINCSISHNTAYWGGGVSYRTSPEQKVITATNIISFTNCTFDNNRARLGSAIDLTVWHGLPVGAYSDIVFSWCQFLNNSIAYTDEYSKLVGKGASYVDTLPVEFIGTNLFKGSALAVLSAGIGFTNATFFLNNEGDNGGAIALLGGSWMTINEGTWLSFQDNKANDKGGAIYALSIGEHDLISSRNCFIRYYNPSFFLQDWNAKFYFINNNAAVAGDSIYATTLLPCLWASSNLTSYNLPDAMKLLFAGNPFYFQHANKSGEYTDIATAASQFSCSKGSFFPGQLKNLPINVTDDKSNNATTYTTFLVSVIETNGTVALDKDTKYSSHQMIRLFGEPNSTAELVLQTTSTTPYSVNTAVDIMHCPPGLCLIKGDHNTETACSCNCSYQGVSSCDAYQSTIAPLFWAGYVNDSHIGNEKYFTTAYCPNGFCSSTKDKFSDYRELDVKICKPQNRTGILCGNCINGTSVYSSSFASECGGCHNLRHGKYFGLLQYALYEIIPLVIFFSLLVLFNFSLTSGPLNSFIFFSQVVSSIAAYNHLFQLNHTDHILIIYSIWNLSFLSVILPSYCLMENWTTLDVFAFHYISAIMPLILVLFVVLMMNYGRVICSPLLCLFHILHRCIPRSVCRLTFVSIESKRFLVVLKSKFFYPDSKVLHGIVAVMVLSYAKFLALSFLMLQPSYSLKQNWPSDISKHGQLRFLLDGSVIYFGPTHIKYAIPAIVLIVILIFPPVILLLRPFLQKYDKVEQLLRRCLPLTRIDLFLNEFYSCYRPNFQWYASLYFFYRLALFISASFTLLSQQYIIQQLLCAAFLIIHCIVQPYNRRFYNVVDGLILGVLLCLSCLEGHYFFVSHGIIEEHWPTEYMGFVLACIPIAYLMIYTLSVTIKHCQSAYHQT